MKIRCSKCGKAVSSEVPDNTVIRAWVECPECIKMHKEGGEGMNRCLRCGILNENAFYCDICEEYYDKVFEKLEQEGD